MRLAQKLTGEPPERLPYGQEIIVGDEVISYETALVWSEEDRNAHGIYTIESAQPAPAGQQAISTYLDYTGSLVREVAILEPAPPVRRLISKDLVMERLDTAGLVDAAQAALLRRPVLFGRWFHKDWPEVYADDADLVAVLGAIGADVEAITAA